MKTCGAQKVRSREIERNRDRDVLEKGKKYVFREENGALGSKNDNYFRSKLECYKCFWHGGNT